MKTKSYKSGSVEKNWHLVDAEDKVLGRLAVKIASILSGKNKAQYSPNADLGDFVIVVNAEKVKVKFFFNKVKEKDLYSGDRLEILWRRCQSRLMEMQTFEYLNKQ